MMGSSVTVASCATSKGVLQSPVLTSLIAQQALMDKFALEKGYVESTLMETLSSNITELADRNVEMMINA